MPISKKRSRKAMSGGGSCTSYSMQPSDIPGVMVPQSRETCNAKGQYGGSKKKKVNSNNNNNNNKNKLTKKLKNEIKNGIKKKVKSEVKKGIKKKLSKKKVEFIIDRLCKNMKKKCTPKYRKLLKEIVIKNM